MTRNSATPPKPWSQNDAKTAAALWQRHFVDEFGDDVKAAPFGTRFRVLQIIARTLDRTFEAVDGRFRMYGVAFGANQRGREISAHTLAQRDARKEAERLRDLTSVVFGDPPPGFSALDRRRVR